MASNLTCPSCSTHNSPSSSFEDLCRENRFHEVCPLLQNGLVNIFFYPSYLTPLHLAAANGCKETVLTLLAHGANADIKSLKGESALHQAVENRKLEIVKILLEFRAEPCECNLCQETINEVIDSDEGEMDFEKELEKMRPLLQGKLVSRSGDIIDINK